jgi:hypothetical protein
MSRLPVRTQKLLLSVQKFALCVQGTMACRGIICLSRYVICGRKTVAIEEKMRAWLDVRCLSSRDFLSVVCETVRFDFVLKSELFSYILNHIIFRYTYCIVFLAVQCLPGRKVMHVAARLHTRTRI